MKYQLRLTEDASVDLDGIHEYIARNDCLPNANQVLDSLENVIGSLVRQPLRGTFPPELLELGIREYREIFFKPYRVIYRVIGRTVYVFLIADGRRDMRTLLARRLLTG